MNQNKKFDIQSMPFFPLEKKRGKYADQDEMLGMQKNSSPMLNMNYFKRKNNYKPKKAFYNTTDYFYPFEQTIEAEPAFAEEQKFYEKDNFGGDQIMQQPKYPAKENLEGNSIDEFIKNNYNCKKIPDSDYISDESLKEFLRNLNEDVENEEQEQKAQQPELGAEKNEDNQWLGGQAEEAKVQRYHKHNSKSDQFEQIQTLIDVNSGLTLEKQTSIQKYFKNSKKIEKIKRETIQGQIPEGPFAEAVVSFGKKLDVRINRHALSNKVEYLEAKKNKLNSKSSRN